MRTIPEPILAMSNLQPDLTTEIHLPSPPFLPVDGLPNFRDCGGYPIVGRPGWMLRKGVIYRSANPSTITEEGISQLRALGIVKVFDLRSSKEIEESTRQGWGRIRVWDPAQRVSVPIFKDSDVTSAHRARRDKNLRKEGHDVRSSITVLRY